MKVDRTVASGDVSARRLGLGWTTAAALALLACSGQPLNREGGSKTDTTGDVGGSGGAGGAGLRGFGGSGGVAVSTEPPLPGGVGDLNLGTIVSADEPPAPISGGTLMVTADGRYAVAADPERDLVSIVKLADGAVTNVPLHKHDEPGRVIQDGAGRVHVALRRGGAVLTLAVPSGEILARRAVCGNPRGLAFDAAAGAVHVACAEGRVVTLAADPAGGITRDLPLDADLRDVVVQGDNLLVSRFRSAEVLVVARDGRVGSRMRPLGQSGPDSTSRPPPGFGPKSPAVAWRLTAKPDGTPVMLHQEGEDSEIDTQGGGYGGKCAGIVSPALTTFSKDGATARTDMRLAQAGLAVDVAVSPGGTFVAVAGVARPLGMPPVTFLQGDAPATSTPMDGCIPPSATPPPDDNTPAPETTDELPEPATYVAPGTNEQIIAVAFDHRGNLIAQAREPSRLLVLTQQRSPIALSNESREDTGHRIFHSVTIGGIACASCHPEGGDDGRVWNFVGLGGRRTQTMRGGITQTAPFHWDGDMNDLGTLMDKVFVGRMSGPPLTAEHVGVLGKFLDAIPALAPARASTDASAARGKVLFASAGCATCHAGTALTNNQTVDVGTGHALQVPSLRGVAYRLPLMHSGCATTMAARFDASCGGGDRHGVTSTLTPNQLADLIAYLETL